MSWAAHEFENYFLQRHTGLKASFLGSSLGTFAPDLFTKALVYSSDDPAQFHRGWPGVGLHPLVHLRLRRRAWACWRSPAAGAGRSASSSGSGPTSSPTSPTPPGVMPFFPFSTEKVTISMWKHAAAAGRYGDASAYYSSLGGVWDLFWFVMLLLFATRTLRARLLPRAWWSPADPRAWGWLHRKLRLAEHGLLLLYRGFLFYGLGRMIVVVPLRAVRAPTTRSSRLGRARLRPRHRPVRRQVARGALRTTIGGVLFAGFLYLCWRLFIAKLWARGEDPPIVQRGRGLRAVFEH